jgi:RNA recognition motif-containing protein
MVLIYVGNVDFRSTEAHLRTAFEVYGQVQHVYIVSSFAFVEMTDEAEADKAIRHLDTSTAWFLRKWQTATAPVQNLAHAATASAEDKAA